MDGNEWVAGIKAFLENGTKVRIGFEGMTAIEAEPSYLVGRFFDF